MAYESEVHINLFLLVDMQMCGLSVCFSCSETNHHFFIWARGRWSLGLRAVFSLTYPCPFSFFSEPRLQKIDSLPTCYWWSFSVQFLRRAGELHSCLLEVWELLTASWGTMNTMQLEGGDAEATQQWVSSAEDWSKRPTCPKALLYGACVSLGFNLRLERR